MTSIKVRQYALIVLGAAAATGIGACDQVGQSPANTERSPERARPAQEKVVNKGPAIADPTSGVAARAGAAIEGAEVFKMPLGDSPSRGGRAAKVTVVVWSEFQCPYCARVEPTLAALARVYGDDLAFVFKHRPAAVSRPRPGGGPCGRGRSRTEPLLGDARQALRELENPG